MKNVCKKCFSDFNCFQRFSIVIFFQIRIEGRLDEIEGKVNKLQDEVGVLTSENGSKREEAFPAEAVRLVKEEQTDNVSIENVKNNLVLSLVSLVFCILYI